jgi:hypothetical protein
VRKLARKAAQAYVAQREEMGYPLLTDEAERARWIKPAESDADDRAGAAKGAGGASA